MRYYFLFLVLAMPIVLIGLYFTNFCFEEMKWIGNEGLIEVAIEQNLRLHGPDMERNKIYTSTHQVLQLNPNCCKILSGNISGAAYPSVFGSTLRTVQVKYVIRDDNQLIYDSYVVVDACGKVVRTYGIILD